MKIFIAGATGAIGQPLVELLIQAGHQVYGTTHNQEKMEAISKKGANPVILDVMESKDVFNAIAEIEPDVVVDMLTRLPKEYTPQAMQKAAEMDAKIRWEGGSHLQAAAEACGVKKYIAQSSGFWYAPGKGLADEKTPFAFEATPGISSGAFLYAKIEERVLRSKKIEGTTLRFGFFYGPGTWFHPNGNVAEQILKQQFPMIGKGQGIWSFIHIEDAAKAIVLAIAGTPGIYNIINDHPAEMREWLPAFARYLKANQPSNLSEEEGEKQKGVDAVYYATKLRGASNAKAKRTLNFQPRPFEWLEF